jgi:heme exporter protein D
MAKKELEGLYEKYLKLFMPIWLTVTALRALLREIREERQRRDERESKY